MKPVFLISPFRGDVKRNVEYAFDCVKDCLGRGEAAFGGHLLYPLVLNDANEADRNIGMEAGEAWLQLCGHGVVYIDLGISSGMWSEIRALIGMGNASKLEFRSLNETFKSMCENLNEIVRHLILSSLHGSPTDKAVTALQHFIYPGLDR